MLINVKTCFLFLIFLQVKITKAQFVNIPNEDFREFLKLRYPTCFNAADMMDTTCTQVIINEDSLAIQYSIPPLGFSIYSLVC